MDLHTLVKSKLTPDDVLSILRDQHRHQCQHDPEAAPDIGLTFDTTVADWRYACDLVGWRQLALALNDYWETKIPLHKWKTALVSPKNRTLRDVCELLAANASTEVVTVPMILGRPCGPAGVFFAVRELLARDGADVSKLRPSTPLADFAIRYASTMAGRISELAPGALPPIKIEHPLYDQRSCLFIVCLITFMGSLAIVEWQQFLWIPLMIVTALSWVWGWYTARVMYPDSITFGELRTFRDLCVKLAPEIRT